jgi:two-component system chemotaxis response regulator CheY
MKSVLIVEDDPYLQFFYKQTLDLNKIPLAGVAKNGVEAVKMFKLFKEKPKVILMDYRMPLKNGIEASKEILQLDNKVKIIFTTADGSINDEAISIGAYSFKDKPFTIKEIIDDIKKALNHD